MLSVSLNDMRFHAFHGVYPEEQQTGAGFLVNVKVDFPEPADMSDLSETVDYEVVYNIVKERMLHAVKLLEEVAQGCVADIFRRFPFVRAIEVSIQKMAPPLGGELRSSEVMLKRSFNQST